MSHLEISRESNNIIVNGFSKDFTFDNADDYVKQMKQIFDTYSSDMILDFSEVTYIDSNGIGQLIHMMKYLKKGLHALSMINVDESVARVLELSKIDKIIPFNRKGENSNIVNNNDLQNAENTAYIIFSHISEEQKAQIRDILKKDCVFFTGSEVNIDLLKNKTEQQKDNEKDELKNKIYHTTDNETVLQYCDTCVERKYFDVIHDVLNDHKNSSIRREIILWSGNIKSDPLILKVLKKILSTEKNDNIQKAIQYSIDKIKKRNLSLL